MYTGYPLNEAALSQTNAAITNEYPQSDYLNPDAYVQSAVDLARYNTRTSQSMAREQMAFQKEQNAKAMAFNATEAQKNRDWQELMSSTAHQREVRDLLEAGLNPILSANQGAATGSGAQAQGVTSAGAKGSVDTSAVSAFMNAFQQINQMRIAEKQIDAQVAMNLLNNQTTRYAADKGAYASISAAGMNASAYRYATDMNKWLYENSYMGTDKLISSVVGSIMNNMGSVMSDQNPLGAFAQALVKQYPWMEKILAPWLPTYDGTGYRYHPGGNGKGRSQKTGPEGSGTV